MRFEDPLEFRFNFIERRELRLSLHDVEVFEEANKYFNDLFPPFRQHLPGAIDSAKERAQLRKSSHE